MRTTAARRSFASSLIAPGLSRPDRAAAPLSFQWVEFAPVLEPEALHEGLARGLVVEERAVDHTGRREVEVPGARGLRLAGLHVGQRHAVGQLAGVGGAAAVRAARVDDARAAGRRARVLAGAARRLGAAARALDARR